MELQKQKKRTNIDLFLKRRNGKLCIFVETFLERLRKQKAVETQSVPNSTSVFVAPWKQEKREVFLGNYNPKSPIAII